MLSCMLDSDVDDVPIAELTAVEDDTMRSGSTVV